MRGRLLFAARPLSGFDDGTPMFTNIGNYPACTRYFHGTRMERILTDLFSLVWRWLKKPRLSVFISPIRVIRVPFFKGTVKIHD
jgi:hypothetical protein